MPGPAGKDQSSDFLAKCSDKYCNEMLLEDFKQ